MPAPVPVTIRQGRPLAPMQRALWMSQRRHPAAPLQNMAKLSHLDAAVDIERLVDAYAAVVAASDALGSRIVEQGGTPLMVPATEPALTEVIDVERADALGWAQRRVATPLDPTVRSYDSVVLRHSDGTVSWYLALHHLVTDAASSALVFAETAAVYHGAKPQIGSYHAWVEQVARDDSAKVQRAVVHWSERTAAPGVGRLYEPIRRPAPESERVPVPLDGGLAAELAEALATDYKLMTDELSWSTLLLTASATLFNKVARVDSFALGMPVHNRSGREAQRVVGTVMEVFPVDVTIEPGDSFRTLHRRVGRAVMKTLRHAVPGHAPQGDYEAVVNVIPAVELGPFGDIKTTHWAIDSGAIEAGHLLRVQLNAYGDDGLGLLLDINQSAGTAEQRHRAAVHYRTILESMIREPDSLLRGLDIRTVEEQAAIAAWELTADFADDTPGIVESLASALADRTDTAIEDATKTLTGEELWAEAVDTASALRHLGVGSGARVGIQMPRSVDTVIAILGTLIAGASYVPLDPAQPESRLQDLVARAGCAVVLTELPSRQADSPGIASTPAGADEAYLLFTSGSTGEPKGVPITHAGLARYIRFAVENYTDPTAPPVAALFSALTFDLTVTSVFVPLVSGGRTVVIEPDGGPGLSAIAARPDITWLKATPSHLEVLVRILAPEHELATLVVGGEAFGANLARRLGHDRPALRIFNEYGPTEAVVGCMIHESAPAELDRWAEVPIGVPAPGVSLAVVDDDLVRVPLGAQGELCISHEGLASGYLGNAAPQTDGPFVELDGRRYYRSGDLVRMADDTTLVYLGRMDEQVKVGGIRLEPIEVEAALEQHPAINRAAVRVWSPTPEPPAIHCTRCGLPSNVPGSTFDQAGVCSVCHAYDRIAPTAASWFKTRDDLMAWARVGREARTGKYDCLALLSGGKDSTYALYQLVEMGFVPYVFTLDNGFISEEAKDNVRRSVADLGLDHEFATTEAMNDIFRDSLERHSNVCHGCYKTIYTLATTRAVELGIPLVITGLSRGQLFETRLIPQQFSEERFDPDAIDRAVISARKAYHRVDDGPNRLLDTSVFDTDDVFEAVTYLDFYRYVDVELAEMLDYLDNQAPWVRPSDTGRSTNCLVNAAGIHTHLLEQGYHNYAEPYAWDVRLGHKTRAEAMEELDDRLDLESVGAMLDEIAYVPTPRQVLTAWVEPMPDAVVPTPAELRAFLSDRLPTHAVPAAFVAVDVIPMTTNGKLDTAALPAPDRTHRSGSAIHVSAESELEADIVAVWEQLLGLEPVGVDDDFFALGGDSLAAMQMAVALSERIGLTVREELPFVHATPRELAAAIELELGDGLAAGPHQVDRGPGEPPELSVGELAILFDQQIHPNDSRYNVGRVYRVHGTLDGQRFADAVRTVAQQHVPLSWTYGTTRRRLGFAEAVAIDVRREPVAPDEIDDALSAAHRRPFDLDDGPLLRCVIQPVADGSSAVLLAFHHASGDADSFDRIWAQADAIYAGAEPATPDVDYPSFTAWQATAASEADREFWATNLEGVSPSAMHQPAVAGPDGFVKRVASFSPATLASAGGSTSFTTALAALAAVLARRSEGDRVGVGVIASTRNHPLADDLVGYLLNTLPVELDCPNDMTFAELTVAAREAANLGFAHRCVPFSEIVAEQRRRNGPQPVTDFLLAFDTLDDTRLGSNHVDHHVMFNGTAVAGTATVFVEVRPDRVDLSMEYRGSALSMADAELLLDDFDAAIAIAASEPETELRSLSLPGDGTSFLQGPELDAPASVVEAIAANIVIRATEPAVISDAETLTWGRLGERSAQLARLLGEAGVAAGDRVIVCLPRSVDQIAAVVAALCMGVAYVPIDPTYPEDRIRLAAELAGAAAALVSDPDLALTPCDIVLSATELPAADFAPRTIGPDDEAYMIFTSGSTGTPRGVSVTHGQLAASTAARFTEYVDHPGRFLLISSLAFDSSVAGLYWALTSGGAVVVPSDAQAHDPDALLALFESAAITHTLLVPTLYQAMLERGSRQHAWPLQVVVAGEACSTALADRHHELRPTSALTNEYGPTECTVWATAHHCHPGAASVPIGGPIAGAWVAVVDQQDNPVPAGVRGELIIGGAGVTNGYVDDAAATSRRFAGSKDNRFFRTGDRAVVIDGAVHFLGRCDHQLNVGGVRAEPGDIERVLLEDPAVGAVIVVAADPRPLGDLIEAAPAAELGVAMARAAGAGDPAAALAAALREFSESDAMLVAHIEPSGTTPLDIADLRNRAQRELPASLRPQRYVEHVALPRSPTGKLDRDAAGELPVPATDLGVRRGGVPDADDLTATVAGLFREVLGTPEVDPDRSFFDLGGHSLLALRLLARIEDLLGAQLSVSVLYESSTPNAIAALIRAGGGAVDRLEYVVPIHTEGSRPPIFGVHVLGSNAEYYRPLAGHLGPDQPVYGLGIASSLADATAPTEIDRISALYADQLERLVPEGPVVLAAVSLGAVVTFELAQRLRARGRDVALVALFDAIGPDTRSDATVGRRRLASHLAEARTDPLRYLRDRSMNIGLRAQRAAERVEMAARDAVRSELPDRLKIRRFIEANVNAALGHELRPYDGPLAVFKAAEDPFGWVRGDALLGWGSVARGGLEIIEVEGGHVSMHAEPHVAGLARALADAIDSAMAEPAEPTALRSVADVDRLLRDEVHRGRFSAAVAELTNAVDLDPAAEDLVSLADASVRAVADHTRAQAAAIQAALAQRGITARVLPVPDRLEHASMTIELGGDPDSAIAALRVLGYVRQEPMSAGAWAAYRRHNTSVTLINLDRATTRVHLVWGPAPDPGRLDRFLRPTRADLAGIDLPRWAWPTYYALRPVRLARDRMLGRRAGGDLGPYLGTPLGMVVPVLALAAVQSDDLVVDLGCGDGRVLIEAAHAFGCRGRGVERDPELAAAARDAVRRARLADTIEIVEADAADADLSDADVVFAFLPAESTAAILPGALASMPAGARFVAHEQLATEWPTAPDETRLILEDGVTITSLWHRP